MRLIVAITGASGAILGIRILEALRETKVETHLIFSKWAQATINIETSYSVDEIKNLADYVYSSSDQAANISSGSYIMDGMIVAPCSMKTLASIKTGLADNLVARAADVTIKEQRKLVLLPRELPLSSIHLDNMLYLSQLGVVMIPPMLTFYNKPETIDDMINHVVARTLDQFGIENSFTRRWKGVSAT